MNDLKVNPNTNHEYMLPSEGMSISNQFLEFYFITLQVIIDGKAARAMDEINWKVAQTLHHIKHFM